METKEKLSESKKKVRDFSGEEQKGEELGRRILVKRPKQQIAEGITYEGEWLGDKPEGEGKMVAEEGAD